MIKGETIAYAINKECCRWSIKEWWEEEKDVLVTVYFHGLKQKHKNGWNDHIKPKYYALRCNGVSGGEADRRDER